MKNVNLEIKRMLSLLESQMGDVKPLISEQIDFGEKKVSDTKDPIETLNRIKSVCLTGKGASRIEGPFRWTANDIKYVNKQKNLTPIVAGEPYVMFILNNGEYYVFPRTDIKGKTPKDNEFYALKRNDNRAKEGETGYENPHFDSVSLDCKSYFEKGKTVTSDVTQLDYEQRQRINNLVSEFGIKETGANLTTEKPTGTEGVDYEPIDLNTGKGARNGIQYIEKTAVDGLSPEFKQPGKYYVWAIIGTSVRKTDVVKSVETALKSMGYTRTEPEDAFDPINREKTTLAELCKRNAGVCEGYPTVMEYIQKYGGSLAVWPSKSEGYKDMGDMSAGGRGSTRGIKDVQKTEANKRSCRTAINALYNCMRSNSDSSCENYIKAAFNEEGKQTPPYLQAMDNLKNQINMCDNLNINVGGKYEDMWGELKKTSSRFSPYSSGKKSGTTLEESLLRNIRSTIKEHARKGRLNSRGNL
jgi:hypothetical protein